MIKIPSERKIVAQKVVTEVAKNAEIEPKIQIPSKIELPSKLKGTSYKIKPGNGEHTYTITINDAEIDGVLRPVEVLINTIDVAHHQWIVAIARLASANLRKGGDYTFIAEELQQIPDPAGGYWYRGKFYISIVSGIGAVLAEHFENFNEKIEDRNMEEYKEAKKEEFLKKGGDLKNAVMCKVCSSKSVIKLDNCMTCLNCGDSKCG